MQILITLMNNILFFILQKYDTEEESSTRDLFNTILFILKDYDYDYDIFMIKAYYL